jgi:retron-type reverse transcriptase
MATPRTAPGPAGAGAERGDASLFVRLTSLDNLHACWLQAKRSKSQSPRVQRFEADPLHYLLMIQQRLRARQFSFGPYKAFTVREKKFRQVIDAPMKDRVVHWMLYRYLLPLWQPRFIHDTYGNLPGRGTHAAVDRLATFCRGANARWALQLDISKYFYSVGHAVLKARALRYVGDHDLRQLIAALVDSFRTDDSYDHLFAADSAYRLTPAKGMPIGNLSSQLFANIFLADFDSWVKGALRVKRYIRYVDDLVVVGETQAELLDIKDALVARLAADGLTVHPRKARIAPIAAGVPFLGYVVWPRHVSAGAYVRGRYLRRLREHESGGYDRSDTLRAYQAMLAHTGPTNVRRGVRHPALQPHQTKGELL